MGHYAGLRVTLLALLLASSAFGLDITVTNAPYNAKPEDGLNDSAAFTSALDAIADAGGGTLSVPCGNYDFTNKVTVDLHAANVTILGDGASISIINCASNNTDGVFFFNNTGDGSQLALKDFTINTYGSGGTGIKIINSSFSANAICSLLMDDVNIMPDVEGEDYFDCQVDASNLKAPVFFNCILTANIRSNGYDHTGIRITSVDSPSFDNTYVKHTAHGYLLTGMTGAANFLRSYTSDVDIGYELSAVPDASTSVSMRHFHSGGYVKGIDLDSFDQVEVLEHMSFQGNENAVVDQTFTDCANVKIEGCIYHPGFDVPRTAIYLKGGTHDVYVANCLFNIKGIPLAQDSTVKGVTMIGCHDHTQ